MPRSSAGVSAAEAVTQYLERICLQDCRNEQRDLTKVEDAPPTFYFLSRASLTASRTM